MGIHSIQPAVPWMVKVERVPSHGKYYVILCSVIGIYVVVDIVLHKESSIVRNPAIYSRPHIQLGIFLRCCSICHQICSLFLICTHLTITEKVKKRRKKWGRETGWNALYIFSILINSGMITTSLQMVCVYLSFSFSFSVCNTVDCVMLHQSDNYSSCIVHKNTQHTHSNCIIL